MPSSIITGRALLAYLVSHLGIAEIYVPFVDLTEVPNGKAKLHSACRTDALRIGRGRGCLSLRLTCMCCGMLRRLDVRGWVRATEVVVADCLTREGFGWV